MSLLLLFDEIGLTFNMLTKEIEMNTDQMVDVPVQDAAWGHATASDADGLELHYVRWGQGTPQVLLLAFSLSPDNNASRMAPISGRSCGVTAAGLLAAVCMPGLKRKSCNMVCICMVRSPSAREVVRMVSNCCMSVSIRFILACNDVICLTNS